MKNKSHHRHHHHRRHLPRPVSAAILAIFVVLLAASVMVARRYLEPARNPDPVGNYTDRYVYDVTREIDGQMYRQKGSVTTLLLMGIDHDSDETPVTGFRSGGQADFLRLVIIDRTENTITQIPIDRDTLAEITVLGVTGEVSGERTAQICLSHSFGDGKEQSGELTREAVSRMLLGARIDFYMAMNLDGIAVLNDTLGGISVTLAEDLTALDPAWTAGSKITLHGEQAQTFVRARMTVSDGTNVSRMTRQQQYVSEAAHILQEKVNQDVDFIGTLFDHMSPYLTGNIGRANLVNLAYLARHFGRTVVEIPGTHGKDAQGFVTFEPDAEALQEIVLRYLFTPV